MTSSTGRISRPAAYGRARRSSSRTRWSNGPVPNRPSVDAPVSPAYPTKRYVGKIFRPPRGRVDRSGSGVDVALALGVGLGLAVVLEDGVADGAEAGVADVEAPGGVTTTSAQPAARHRATEDRTRRGRADTTDHDTRPGGVDGTFLQTTGSG